MMNNFTLEVELRFLPKGANAVDGCSDKLDCIVSHLYDELGVHDLAVVANTEAGELHLSWNIEGHIGESVETTLGKALGSLRTAIHACGVGTPGWPILEDVEIGDLSLKRAAKPLAIPGHRPELVEA